MTHLAAIERLVVLFVGSRPASSGERETSAEWETSERWERRRQRARGVSERDGSERTRAREREGRRKRKKRLVGTRESATVWGLSEQGVCVALEYVSCCGVVWTLLHLTDRLSTPSSVFSSPQSRLGWLAGLLACWLVGRLGPKFCLCFSLLQSDSYQLQVSPFQTTLTHPRRSRQTMNICASGHTYLRNVKQPVQIYKHMAMQ